MKVKFHTSFEACNTRFITSFKTEDFKQWILSLKPKDVRDKGISKQSLSYTKSQIRKGSGLIRKTKINEILFKLYDQTRLNI
jgi:hypothetical protein